jgi:enediyne biosynthesis protein E4
VVSSLAMRQLLSALALGCAALFAAAQVETAFDDRLARAAAALQARDLDEAEALFRELTTLYPQQVAPYQGLAEVFAAQGRPDEAVELLLDLGRELLQLVRAGEAVAPLELAVRLAPARADVHALLGRVLGEEEHYAAAIAALERAGELGDRQLLTLLALATSYWESGRYEAAEETYRRTLAEYPDSFHAHFHGGRFLLWRGRAAEALPLLETAAEMRRDDVDAWYYLGRARAESGDQAGAVAAYERVLVLDPAHPFVGSALELARARAGTAAATATPAPAPTLGRRGAILTEVAREAGISFRHDPGTSPDRHLPETMGAGLAWLDADGDGWLDLYLVQSGPFPPDGSAAAANVLYRNLGGGRFADRTDAAGAGDRCYGQGVLAADFDGDGDSDLYLTCFGADVLLDNRGGRSGAPTFVDVTAERGLGADGWKTSAAAADADGDGDLDLYVERYVGYGPERQRFCGDTENGEPEYCNVNLYAGDDDLLYLQDDGRFREVTAAAGIGHPAGRGLGVVWTDLDGDLRPDLYVANDIDFNRLYRSRGDGTFEDVSELSGAAFNREGKGEASMGVDAADLDGDGLPEILLTHFDVETNTLYQNLGDLQFEDASATSGFGLPSFNLLGFGVAVADFDLDGNPDAYVANGHVFEHPTRESTTRAQRDLLLLGDGRGHFAEQPFDSPVRISRGAAAADFDNDGDADLAVQNSGELPTLWRNDGAAVHWLGVALQGGGRNSEAIGARVVLITGRGRRTQWVKAGSSYLSSADRRLLYSWTDETPVELEVTWPGGRTLRLRRPPSGRYLRIPEPRPEP